MNSELIGIGAALPKKCVTNEDLSKTIDTSDEWISSRTGIKCRYIADESETTVSLATIAAQRAMQHAGVSPKDVDLVIVGTVTGNYTFPATAVLVQKELGIHQGCAFDVSAACSGFLYGVDIADSFIKGKKASCALVIGAETFSRILDWKDRSSCVLFGDGAGAAVLRSTENQNIGIKYSKIHSDGDYADFLITSGGISTTQSSGVVTMQGREVFRHGIDKFYESFCELLKENNLTVKDIDLLIPHQANVRIISKLVEMTGIEKSKVVITIDKYANTSAASIPLAMNEVRDTVFTKKNVVLLSMGAGFTWGATLISFVE